jgi:cyclohexyl-isocyanide hydratase
MSVFNIGFVIFPELTQLDFTGPQQVLARTPLSAMHIVAKTASPVPSESGLSLVPTHTFENCPQLDLICVPGIKGGKAYYGEVAILGTPYITGYEPIKDSSGAQIGVYYVGYKK